MAEYDGATSKSQITDPKDERKQRCFVMSGLASSATCYILMNVIALGPLCMFICNGALIVTPLSQAFQSMLITIMRVMTWLLGNVVAAIGDRFGRKKVLGGAIFGYSICSICYTIGLIAAAGATEYPSGGGQAFLMIGVIILGFSSPNNPHATAFMMDISVPSRRAGNVTQLQGIGLMGGLSLGFLLSIIILAGGGGLFGLLFGGIVLGAVATVIIVCMAREPLTPDMRTKASCTDQLMAPCGGWDLVKSTPYSCMTFIMIIFLTMVSGATESIFVSWFVLRNAIMPANVLAEICFFLALVFFAGMVMTVALGTPLVRKIGVYKAFNLVNFLGVVANIIPVADSAAGSGTGFTPTLIAWVFLSALSAPSLPYAQTIYYNQMNPEQVGRASGLWRSSEALGKYIGSFLVGYIIFFGALAKAQKEDGSLIKVWGNPSHPALSVTFAMGYVVLPLITWLVFIANEMMFKKHDKMGGEGAKVAPA